MTYFKPFLLGLLLITLLPWSVSAHNTTNAHGHHQGSKYLSGEARFENDGITGDLFYTGEELNMTGEVGDNLFAAAGKVTVAGDVFNSAYLAAGQTLIDGNIGNDLYVTSGYVVINGYVAGDLRVAGGTVIINSQFIGGDLLVGANEVYINPLLNVTGEQKIDAGKVLEFSESDLPRDLTLAPEYDFWTGLAGAWSSTEPQRPNPGSLIVEWLISFLGTILAAYTMLRLFPNFAEKTLQTMKAMPMQSITAGLVTFLLGMIVAFALLVSIIGTDLLLLLLLIGILAIMLGYFYACYMVGRLVLIRAKKKKTGRLLALVSGVLIVELSILILGLLPVLGGSLSALASCTLVCWGMGAIVYNKYYALRKK